MEGEQQQQQQHSQQVLHRVPMDGCSATYIVTADVLNCTMGVGINQQCKQLVVEDKKV